MAETFQSLYLISAIKVFMGSSSHLQSELSPLLLLPLLVFTGEAVKLHHVLAAFTPS